MDATPVSIVCQIKAKEQTRQQVRDELRQLAALTRQEAGNLCYDLHVARTDESLFILYEHWQDQAALDSHMDQPYFKDFVGKAAGLLERPVEITFCTKI